MENLFGLSETLLTIIKVLVPLMFVGVAACLLMNTINEKTGEISKEEAKKNDKDLLNILYHKLPFFLGGLSIFSIINEYIKGTVSVLICIPVIILAVFVMYIYRKH